MLISLQHFLGNTRVKTFYSDNAREIIKAVQDLGFGGTMRSPNQACHKPMASLNGQSRKSYQEHVRSWCKQVYLDMFGARQLCATACSTLRVFPHIHCVQACDAADGTDVISVEHSAHPVVGEEIPHNAWSKRHGADFTGQRLPFGCGVYFKPAVTKYVLDKANARASFGISLATGRHRVADGMASIL